MWVPVDIVDNTGGIAEERLPVRLETLGPAKS
jgi:hypothetical protein